MKIDREAWREVQSRVGATERGVLADLLTEADYRTGSVEGSVLGLARRLRFPETTFRRHLQALKEAGQVETSDGVVRLTNYATLVGSAADGGSDSESSAVRGGSSAVRGGRDHSSPVTEPIEEEEKRSSTYDDPDASQDHGSGDGSAASPSGDGGEENTAGSSSRPLAGPAGSRRTVSLDVPSAWADTGSWGRTLRDSLAAEDATLEEAEEVGERLRPAFDEGRLKPSRNVVAEELRRVREEGEAEDWSLAWFELQEDIRRLAGPQVAERLVPARHINSPRRPPPPIDDLRASVLERLQRDEVARETYVSWRALTWTCRRCGALQSEDRLCQEHSGFRALMPGEERCREIARRAIDEGRWPEPLEIESDEEARQEAERADGFASEQEEVEVGRG